MPREVDPDQELERQLAILDKRKQALLEGRRTPTPSPRTPRTPSVAATEHGHGAGDDEDDNDEVGLYNLYRSYSIVYFKFIRS